MFALQLLILFEHHKYYKRILPLPSAPTSYLETVQDFLIKLGIKPRMHLLEISIFSINHIIVRPAKIMNNLLKDCKIRTFKVTFQHQKSTESFQFFSVKNIRPGDQFLKRKFFENFDF